MTHTLHLGDCRTVLSTLDDNSIDSIVCDPPYELGFMGKAWDSTGIAYDVTVWQQCLRVLKPGGHLVAFGGSRTYHRLAVAIEDAGFEIRDQIQWIYGQGYPKSHNLKDEWKGFGTALKPAHEPAVLARKPLCGTVADNVTTWGVGALNIDGTRVGGDAGRWPANVIFDEKAAQILDEQSGERKSPKPNPAMPYGQGDRYEVNNIYQKGLNRNIQGVAPYGDSGGASRFFYTVPSEYNCCLCYNTCAKDMTTEEICKHILVSNAANHGWITQETNEFTAHVTALLTQNAQLVLNVKSAIPQCALCATSIAVALVEIRTLGFNHQRCERILGYMPRFASSILIRSLASFAELWGSTDIIPTTQNLLMLYGSVLHAIENYIKQESKARVAGDNDQVQAMRFLYNAKASKAEREAGLDGMEQRVIDERDKSKNMLASDWRADLRSPNGGYENKPTQPRANHHPTVKPLALMRYLVRLVTPKGGKVLDPFMGSGSTGCAAVLEGCDFVGIDITPEYVAIAQKRIDYYAVETPLEGMV